MEKFVLFLDRNHADASPLSLSSKASRRLDSIKFKKFKKMKIKSIVFGILLLPIFMHAQNPENCSGIVALPKPLYDSFQTLKANLDGADREITKQRAILDDLQRTYLGCVTQPDIAAMINDAGQAMKTAEANRKTSEDAFDRVDKEVKDFIRAAHRPVAFRYLEPYYGDFGRVVTMHFDIVEDKVSVTPSFYQLPGTVSR
jgi:hypothetical protein